MRNHLLRSTMALAVMWAVWWLAPNPPIEPGEALTIAAGFRSHTLLP